MKKHRWLWVNTAVLLLSFFLAVNSLAQKSPTFDEQGFLVRGLGYVRGENRHMRVGHPLGLNALSASLLAADERVKLPTQFPEWQETSFHRPAEQFLWELGNDVELTMFLARLPTVWLGLLLATLTARWAWALSQRQAAGALTLALIALDPNILAHMRLTTTDLGLTFGATVAGFGLWRFLKRPSFPTLVLAAVGFAILQNTKFTAGLFVPLFTLVILVGLWYWWRSEEIQFGRSLGLLLIGYPLLSFVALWGMYGFQIGTLPAALPTLPQLGGLTLPLAHHLEQLLDIGGRVEQGATAFLLGDYSFEGWWYYFPVAFGVKTSVVLLLLLLFSLFTALFSLFSKRAKSNRIPHTEHRLLDWTAVLLPPLGYFAIAMTTNINIGYRHLLPILPFLSVWVAVVVSGFLTHKSGNLRLRDAKGKQRGSTYWMVWVICGWLAIVALWIHPHHLAYFNLLGGGPDGGWRILVDSNIDWGQDLAGLAVWLEENEVGEPVWLSYFGEARPDYYGIDYIGLDSFPPRLMSPARRPFYPHDPAPGLYAISVTNLQGVLFADRDQFAFFREREPLIKIGYSIFLYDVEPRGEPVDLVLGGMQLDELETADFAQLNSNQVTPHWFDPTTSWLQTAVSPQWLAIAAEQSPAFRPFLTNYDEVGGNADYRLLRLKTAESVPAQPLTTFRLGEGQLDLLEVRVETAESGQLDVQTVWRQQANPHPVKLFIHVTDASGDIVAQWDGLGAAWQSWAQGAVLWQRHQIGLPSDLVEGDYDVWLGAYVEATGERWQLPDGAERFSIDDF